MAKKNEEELAKRGSNRMDYLCLRNCVVNDRLWKEGKVYTLPSEMKKSPKNFRRVGVSEDEAEEALNIEHELEQAKPPVEVPEGSVWCPEHRILHKLTTKIGKRCKKKYNL